MPAGVSQARCSESRVRLRNSRGNSRAIRARLDHGLLVCFFQHRPMQMPSIHLTSKRLALRDSPAIALEETIRPKSTITAQQDSASSWLARAKSAVYRGVLYNRCLDRAGTAKIGTISVPLTWTSSQAG